MSNEAGVECESGYIDESSFSRGPESLFRGSNKVFVNAFGFGGVGEAGFGETRVGAVAGEADADPVPDEVQTKLCTIKKKRSTLAFVEEVTAEAVSGALPDAVSVRD
jgi:hypothetical protein